jgi:hypothetical protein
VRVAALLIGVLLSPAVLVADDRMVLFDHDVDFSKFKTFTLRAASVDSKRPEINSPITTKKLTDGISAALQARGLKEAAQSADLVVETTVKAIDYGIGPFGRANPIGRGRGGAQASTPDFTDATLIIDLKAAGAMVWRGVYRDTENSAPKLAEALPKHAANLLKDYPPGKKK